MFGTLSIVALVLTAVAIVVHYFAFGPRHGSIDTAERAVKRFNLWAIAVHGLLGLSLLVLVITGGMALAKGAPLRGWPLFLHYAASPLFSLALTLKALTWAGACAFEAHDWEWFRHLGGYLGDREGLPASRFNAGQKAFFWAIVVLGIAAIVSGLGRMSPVLGDRGQALLYHAHRGSALLLMLSFVVHFYLATFANPGTLLAMVSGRVSPDWAAHHHPLWWQRVREKEEGEKSDE